MSETLRAYVGRGVEAGGVSFSVYLRGKNLTDDEQRNHASLVKDLVPEPGRTIDAGVRVRASADQQQVGGGYGAGLPV